jgi:hypothetical protein
MTQVYHESFLKFWDLNSFEKCLVVPSTTYSFATDVYLVFKIRFIKYRFLKSTFRLRGRKRSTIVYTNNRLQRFIVPSVQSLMFHCKTCMLYQLNYGVEYLSLRKVMWYQQKVKYADNKSSAYLRGTWLKTKNYQTVILAYLQYVSMRIIA